MSLKLMKNEAEKRATSGVWDQRNSWCSCVVYQPRKMGTNEMMAGDSHVLSSITPTTRLVMLRGYLRGITMA
ncbi:ATP-dependent RNA helicase TDRD9 [Frankliniella fusca]|uniref:ATP-dependent RNA helicase TDRD9 n=1 Tax=Frankliniella fusca TaxID=407009 RepID=A0AAE1LF39_9NEOP|nr:ATP-dependent RNA helicase TDRD9 [Frankliniella fusca]